ncbi:MAG: hypothetical protein RL021_1867 [Bacteroidota bacterium]
MNPKMISLSRLLMLLAAAMSTVVVSAESFLTFDAGQQYASFRFIDSDGQQDKDYSGVYSGAFGVGYRYVAESGFMARAGVGMNRGGASKVYDASNYTWFLEYASVSAGAGWMFLDGKVRPYFSVAPYYSRLLRGTQTLNNEDFDIKQSERIGIDDYGFHFLPGIHFSATERLHLFAEFDYKLGLQNLDPDPDQIANNRSVGVAAGIAIRISQ